MLNPGAIAANVATSLVTEQATNAAKGTINRITGQEQPPAGEDKQDTVIRLLAEIRDALSSTDNPNLDFPMAFQPYPYEYVSDMATYGKGHLSIFFHDATPIRADIAGVGSYYKTVGPGWLACDLWASTRFSTTDGQNHNVIVSYRTNTIGSAL